MKKQLSTLGPVMSGENPPSQNPGLQLRIAALDSRRPTVIDVSPDEAALGAVADALGITAVRKLRFEGELAPEGKSDWRLTGHLGATVVQPCVITLEPVTTRLEEPVERRYLAAFSLPEDGSETEMPEDDSAEELPETLDLGAVIAEAVALALPPYPRVDGAEGGEMVFTEPGKTAMTDDAAKPFASLGALRARMKDGDT
ncbi:MAG: DUF177 domain-containing protein [Pseudomonadota bacterium]